MIDRRQALALLAGSLATPALAQTGTSRMTAYAFSFAGLKGGDIKLADFAGKPILVVNTASQCGYTPQYAGLQQIWTEFQGRGFGQRILDELEARALALGYKALHLDTSVVQLAAQHLYRKNGFRETGRVVHRGLECILFEKSLV